MPGMKKIRFYAHFCPPDGHDPRHRTVKFLKYFFGIDYTPRDVRLALIEASGNKIGGTTGTFLLYCFHYDPATGKYGLAIDRALKAVGGVLTVAGNRIFHWINDASQSSGS